jgi:hypothetical protein
MEPAGRASYWEDGGGAAWVIVIINSNEAKNFIVYNNEYNKKKGDEKEACNSYIDECTDGWITLL